MSIFHDKPEGLPQYVRYFEPIRQALRAYGGQAAPKQVCE